MRSEAVIISGAAKVYLDAIVALFQRPSSAIVAEAILSFVRGLPEPDRAAIDAVASRALRSSAPARRHEPQQSYKYSRLCFKRKVIDPLNPDDQFRIETPVGVFQMSRSDFDAEFGNIRDTTSWKHRGFYSYPVVPSKAEKYRVDVGSTSP